MKKESKEAIDPIAIEIKAFSKRYKALNRDGIRIIYEFCEYSKKKTNKILTMLEDIKNPYSVIQELIKDAEKS